jgi:hypothetical protein
VPVQITAVDIHGESFTQDVMTLNVSQKGALLTGIKGKLRLGSEAYLSRSNKREPFLIMWVGEEKTPKAGQLGVSAINPATAFWSDAIDPAYRSTPSGTERDSDNAKPKAMAQGA